MKFKGSQGEWRMVNSYSVIQGIRNDNGLICTMIQPARYHKQEERYNKEVIERNADAALIAASKFLLNACTNAKTELMLIKDAPIEVVVAIGYLEAAIKKATA